jgi:hypothetical protein
MMDAVFFSGEKKADIEYIDSRAQQQKSFSPHLGQF